jgi:CheY-like chemotaxis protein
VARILIIEDDPEVRDFLESLLERAGYETVTAANGKEGVDVFTTSPVDLVITDIIMPEKDGIETIMDMKRLNPSLKVIAISGGGRSEPEDYLHSARLLGADQAIRKPFDNEDFVRSVRELLG